MDRLGSEHVFIVHGEDGLDEFSTTAGTRVTELKSGDMLTKTYTTEKVGFEGASPADLAGGDSIENASIINGILAGEKGPNRDISILNAGLAIVAAGKETSIADGIATAQQSIDSGAALAKFEALVNFSAEA